MKERFVPCCLAAVLTLLAALAGNPRGSVLAAAGGPTALPGAVPGLVSSGRAEVVGIESTATTVSISVGLPLRNASGLSALLASPRRQPLDQNQVNQQFDPTPDQESRVIGWLQANGLTVTSTYPNLLMVDARGSVGRVDTLFGITIKDYQATIGGQVQSFYAPDRAPTIPATVSDVVQSVAGLDSIPRFRTYGNGQAHGAAPYYPQDFANAYDVNPLWSAGATGAGEHIGITLWTVPPSDMTLQHFQQVTGANVATTANGRLHVLPVDGGSGSADTGEAAMDIEYSSGLAPGATIDYYEAPVASNGQPTTAGLLDALNLAGTDANANRQISSSWGECEASSLTDPFTQQAENIFASNTATGHTYVFSSGDNGSWCDPQSNYTGQDPYPAYPASSPNVTSVGGTAFSGTIGSTYPGEVAWAYCGSCSNGHPAGSGGGFSTLFAAPSWQAPAGTGKTQRGYPDLAAAADPRTGAEVCYGASSTCITLGGTSLGTPLWAGMLASVNSFLAARGAPTVASLDAALYTLGGSPAPYPAFHDISAGTNGHYSAGAGWDAVTGWGSTDLNNLARDLALGAAPAGQLLVNSGFEFGQTPWLESSAVPGKQLIETSVSADGTSALGLCGYTSCLDQAWQTISLPAGFSEATFTYWLDVVSQQPYDGQCHGWLNISFHTTTGTDIGTAQTVCNGKSTPGWTQQTVSAGAMLRPYAGQQVQVVITGQNDTAPPTTFYVDDATLTVSGSTGATPVPTATTVPRSKIPTTTPTATITPTPTITPSPEPTYTPVPAVCPQSQAACIQVVLGLVNGTRKQYGLTPYTLNMTESSGTSTCVGSYGHSVHMAQTGQLSHDQFPADICIAYHAAGENVGVSSSGNSVQDLNSIHNLMMSEPHDPTTCSKTINHACNIISQSYSQIGIGVYFDGTNTWLTEDFVG